MSDNNRRIRTMRWIKPLNQTDFMYWMLTLMTLALTS